MTKRSLLLVDGDARSLRVLEVSLKKAGFNVTTAVNGRDALEKVRTYPPDLIISDTEMGEMDGFQFCEALKQHADWSEIPFIFLTNQGGIENKIRGLELGVEDYLTKPIYIKEILTRVRILLQKRERTHLETKKDGTTRFIGALGDMGVVDLIQTIEVSRKTGLIHFIGERRERATIYFRSGKLIDAEAGHLQGEDAIYRLLTWSEGEFEVLFRSVRRKDVIRMSSQGLLMEGMRRLDEWGRLGEQLPPLDARFEVEYDELWERLADLPDELNPILRLIDGRRSLMEVINRSGYGDLECLEVIAKLYFEGIIAESKTPPPDDDLVEQAIGAAAPLPIDSASHPIVTRRPVLATPRPVGDPAPEISDPVPVPITDPEPRVAVPVASAEAPALLSASGLAAASALDEEPKVLPDQGVEPGSDEQALVPNRTLVGVVPTARSPGLGRDPGADTVPEISDDDLGIRETHEVDETDFSEISAEIDSRHSDAEVAAAMGAIPVSSPLPSPLEHTGEYAAVSFEDIPDLTGGDSEPSDGFEASAAPQEIVDDEQDGLEGETNPNEISGEFEAGIVRKPINDGSDPTPLPASVEPSRRTLRGIAVGKSSRLIREEDEISGEFNAPKEGELAAVAVKMISSEGAEIASVSGDIQSPPTEPDAQTAREIVTTAPASVVAEDAEEEVEEPTIEEVPPPRIEVVLPEHQPVIRNARVPAVERRGRRDRQSRVANIVVVSGIAALALVVAFLVIRNSRGTVAANVPDASSAHVDVQAAADAGPVIIRRPNDAAIAEASDSGIAEPVAIDAAPLRSRADAGARRKRVDAGGDEAGPDEEPATFDRLYSAAKKALSRGQNDRALELIDEALSVKQAARGLLLKAQMLQDGGDKERALATLNVAARVASRSPSVWKRKGLLHWELEQYSDAKRALQRYLELRPNAKDADDVQAILESM